MKLAIAAVVLWVATAAVTRGHPVGAALVMGSGGCKVLHMGCACKGKRYVVTDADGRCLTTTADGQCVTYKRILTAQRQADLIPGAQVRPL